MHARASFRLSKVLLLPLILLWPWVLWPFALEASQSVCVVVTTLSQPGLWWQYPHLAHWSPHRWGDSQNVWTTWQYPLCPHIQGIQWIFILQRIRRKTAFPPKLWRTSLVLSPLWIPLSLSITAQWADSLAGWRFRKQTQSFCSKSWCFLALSECSSLRSWRALVCWVKVGCLGADSGMKQELPCRERRREQGWRVRKYVWWGR